MKAFAFVVAVLMGVMGARVALAAPSDIDACDRFDAVCVSEVILERMTLYATPAQKRQLRRVIRRLRNQCGFGARQLQCSGKKVLRGIDIVLGAREDAPIPGRRLLKCIRVPGYGGLFPARVSDNYHFGGAGFPARPYEASCEFATANVNRTYGIFCSRTGNGAIPTRLRDAQTYGIAMDSLAACVRAVRGMRGARLCRKVDSSPSRYQVVRVDTGANGRGGFRTLDRCLAFLAWR